MGRRIKVTTLDEAAWPGRFICPPDSDYPADSLVPEDEYETEEQDWQRVNTRYGHADMGTLVLEYHDGTPWTAEGWQWSAEVWMLVEEDGTPVEQDEPNGS